MRKSPPSPSNMDLNLAPMVDVIMCLLIFFMLATKMVEQESSREIDLPKAMAAKDSEIQELGNRFVVNVAYDVSQQPGKVTYLLREEPYALSAIRAALEAQGKKDKDVNCIIRGDRNVPYKHIEAVFKACAAAGISRITFSAVKGVEAAP